MKKFLSLVLALIMTMSLVTISAGATEYRDLTDKDEIQYEEAVAVLNRIGVITGYEDGSFRPETELTRGAAAKIIVSLMIGPDAASALPNNASPYPDVPAGHTFAGVIGYCKTAGYISGYGDGTFKPANPLTGYAFAKMLLGAIGYKSDIEGFVDTGWTMNVARIGNVAGLFDRLNFDGAKAVTRDEACQLALNTLKATMVDYGNSNTVVSSNGQVLTVQGSKAQYVTSNNRDINANINRRVISAANNELTLEFGEEHFKDLRLEHDRYDPAYDIYGHPSNEWSYKKVTIGTFKLPADFTFTKQMAHLEDTQATKEKALGLRGYDTYSTDHRGGYVNWSTAASSQYAASPFADATQIHINGWKARVYRTDADYKQTTPPAKTLNGQWYSYDARDIGAANKTLAPSLSELCDLTDNGVTVEVYVCPVDADFITDVVVTRTQLVEVDRIASDFVELDTISSDSKDPRKDGDLHEIAGYNDYALFDEIISVKDNNYDAYNVLKDLKSGDEVAIIPYTSDDGKTWEVGEAYVPETVSGALTNVDIYNTKSKADGNAVAITVGGTTYPIAQWNKDMREITGTKIRATKKDVTLLLDKMGNALMAKDVGNANNWIVVGDYYQAAGASGRVNWFVHGWTIKGDEVDLELSSIRGAAEKYAPGELVKYDIASVNNGEYELYKPNYNQLAVLKNGDTADWTEPLGAVKDKVQTGEGIYNVAQYAVQTKSDGSVGPDKYSIKSVNTLLPLEFYNTNSSDKDKAFDTAAGIHYNYANATTAAPGTIVGTDPAKGECGILTGATAGGNDFYQDDLATAKSSDGTLTQVVEGDADVWHYRTAPYDGVKFIYVGFDANGEVEVINFLDGVQNVTYKELIQINRAWKNVGTNNGDFVASPAEAYVDKDGKVKAVVIKSDSAEANLKDLMIITDNRGANTHTKGGAEAPTSGTYYTRQYVSGEDGFKEEKTGYFDKALLVGDVITGSMQASGIIRAKYFHANDYTNRNPDGMYIKGIAPLTTQEGKKSNSAFYVGTLASGTTLALGNGVSGSRILALTDKNCTVLSGKDVLGVNDGTKKEGLIKVDSTTQWIDLRDGRPGDIDELSDLFDLKDDANIELKLILNGNPESDGFRHAYAVMILTAATGKSQATAPKFDITVDDTKADYNTTDKVYEYKEAEVDEIVDLGVEFTNEADLNLANVTYKWTVSAGGRLSAKNSRDVEFSAKKAGEYAVTVTAQYTDTSKDIEKSVEVTKTIKITVGTTTGTSQITFKDTAAANGATELKGSAVVGAGNKVHVELNMKVPSWASNVSDAATTTVEVEYRVNGAYAGVDAFTGNSGSNDKISILTDSKSNATNLLISSDATSSTANVGDNIEVIITKVTYDKTDVEIVDEKDVDLSSRITAATTNVAKGANGKFYIPTDTNVTAGTLTLTTTATDISGVTIAVKANGHIDKTADITVAKSGTPGTNVIGTLALNSFKAKGDGAVKIVFSGVNALAELYKVDTTAVATAATGDGTNTIAITASPDANVEKGGTVTMLAKVTGGTGTAYAYEVEATVRDTATDTALGTVKGVVTTAGTSAVPLTGDTITLNANAVVKAADVKITKTITAPAVETNGVEATNNQQVVNVTFDRKIRILDQSQISSGTVATGGTAVILATLDTATGTILSIDLGDANKIDASKIYVLIDTGAIVDDAYPDSSTGNLNAKITLKATVDASGVITGWTVS